MRHRTQFMLLLLVTTLVTLGCVTPTAINTGFYRLGKAWELEIQKEEDLLRFRVVDSDYATVVDATRKTFLNLGMPVQASSLEKGVVIAENVAPLPLTQEEWLRVKEEETPRMKEVGGWFLKLEDDPKDYIITVRVRLSEYKGSTFMVLDYLLDAPKYRRMGYTVPPTAPPAAVRIGASKFWSALQDELERRKISAPRKRRPNEWVA